jgi:hypothetical protein
MRTPINKNSNFETEGNTLKYRVPLTEIKSDDLPTIEKNLKRKVKAIETDPYYLVPYDMTALNSSLVFYYDMVHYKSFDYIRQFDFKDKLKYFISLVNIAKKQNETQVLWDRLNFLVDEDEQMFKVIVFETEDITIKEHTDEFKGVKELIITSLTTLTKVMGKPKLNDFIDKGQDVIQFTETILKIDNLDDLENYISTKQIEYEHGLNEDGEALAQPDSNKKIPIPFKTKKKKQSNKKQNVSSKKKKNNGSKMNKWIYVLAALLPIALILNFMSPSPGDKEKSGKKSVVASADESSKDKVEKHSDAPKSTNDKYNEKLLEAYRLSLTGSYKEAISILEGIGYNNLSAADRTILLNIYDESQQYHKIIDLEPNKAKDIVNELIANNKNDILKEVQEKMETKNPYVDFEVAYSKEKWETIIELQNEIDLNGLREQQIVEAYVALEKYNEAKKFAEKVGNPILLEEVKSYTEN